MNAWPASLRGASISNSTRKDLIWRFFAARMGVLANFKGAQTEVSFVPIYHGMPAYIESLKEFESRGFGVVDFMPVAVAADGLEAMEMDCILVRKSELA